MFALDLAALYLLCQAVALALVFAADRDPEVGRFFLGLLLIVAALVNLPFALFSPEVYADAFGPGAIVPYQRFIFGPFTEAPGLVVGLFVLLQAVSGALILRGVRRQVKVGLALAALFFLSLAPLGLSAAFPSTVVLAAAPLLLMRHAFCVSSLQVVRRRWRQRQRSTLARAHV